MNGFRQANDDYLAYACAPLRDLGPIQLGDFKDCLIAQHKLLLSEELAGILDAGIRSMHRSSHYPYQASIYIQEQAQISNFQTAGSKRAFCAAEAAESVRSDSWSSKLSHLLDVTNMSSGMISAHLAEKHRNIIYPTCDSRATDTTHFQPEANARYISPYNLNERAKKLLAPNAAKFPCICDPECICTALCAIDLSRDCLCEENGLFVRVTGGMNIDDLDVPDLERRANSTSGSEISSVSDCSSRQDDGILEHFSSLEAKEQVMFSDMDIQKSQQKAQVLDEFDFAGPEGRQQSSFDDLLGSEGHNPSHTSTGFDALPYMSLSRATAAFDQSALRRPFSTPCDTPPRRPSTRLAVAERLFGGKGVSRLVGVKQQPMAARVLGSFTKSTRLSKLDPDTSAADLDRLLLGRRAGP